MHRIEAYVTLAFLILAVMGVLYLPILFFLKKRGIGLMRQCSYVALIWSVFLIVFATILFTWPITFGPEQHSINLMPFEWLGDTDPMRTFVEFFIPNIMMFVPFGYFLPVVFRSMRRFYKTACLAFCVSFSVEFFQYFIGRGSNVDDLIANSLGCMIGYGLFKLCDRLFRHRIG